MKVALIAPKGLISLTKGFGNRQVMDYIIPGYSAIKGYESSDRYKILDNGAFEYGESIEAERLIKLAKLSKANEIILPDVLFDREETFKRTKEFLETVEHKWSFAVVPQGKDPEDWIKAYIDMCRLDGVDVICIPKWLESKFHVRAAIISYLKKGKIWKHIPHHLLGVDTLAELTVIRPIDIRSIDSAKPVTYGYYSKLMPWFMKEKLQRPHKFAQPSSHRVAFVNHNINQMIQAANWNGTL